MDREEVGSRRSDIGNSPASPFPPPSSDFRLPSSDLRLPASDLRPPARDLRPPSSTGLAPATASALAYLAGPFSGALILLAETSNDDVRFHAWQSIVGLGGLTLVVIASYAIGIASIFISATAVSVMFGVATVIWLVLLIVWAMCLWKAAIGARWHLPLAGDYAERFATRRSTAEGRVPSAD